LDPAARVATSLRASLYGIPASTRYRLTMNLAINQRAQRRDRTNVFMCHLDHLLQLPWAHRRRVPPTEAAPQIDILRMTSIAARVKTSRCQAAKKRPRRPIETLAWLPSRFLINGLARKILLKTCDSGNQLTLSY
jgi:hypothetical protein